MTKPEELPCRFPNANPDDWFRKPGSPANLRAKQACTNCPVMEKCRQVGLEDGMPFGVWGGLDERDREHIWANDPNGRPRNFVEMLDDAINGLLQQRRDDQRNGLAS